MCQSCEQGGRVVAQQNEWHQVVRDLAEENLKPALYDGLVAQMMGDVRGRKVLDYGAGPGVMASALQKMGADIKVWDINAEMRAAAAKRIGTENVYESLEEVPYGAFDLIVCNLVLCIVPHQEVVTIVREVGYRLRDYGRAFVGFCNPRIFQVAESQFDFRFPTGAAYEDHHRYKKVKKEGGYEIYEDHRPEEWYERVFAGSALEVYGKRYTPEYEMNGVRIQDFVVYEISRLMDP